MRAHKKYVSARGIDAKPSAKFRTGLRANSGDAQRVRFRGAGGRGGPPTRQVGMIIEGDKRGGGTRCRFYEQLSAID